MAKTNGEIDEEERAEAAQIADRVLSGRGEDPLSDMAILSRQLLRALNRDPANRHLISGNFKTQK